MVIQLIQGIEIFENIYKTLLATLQTCSHQIPYSKTYQIYSFFLKIYLELFPCIDKLVYKNIDVLNHVLDKNCIHLRCSLACITKSLNKRVHLFMRNIRQKLSLEYTVFSLKIGQCIFDLFSTLNKFIIQICFYMSIWIYGLILSSFKWVYSLHCCYVRFLKNLLQRFSPFRKYSQY